MVEEEVEDDQIEVDKLVAVLRLAGKSPEPASPGPAVSKKKTTRWVKKKVRRRKKEAVRDESEQARAPPPPHLLHGSRSSSPAASPALGRKEPGGSPAPNKPPPPPPPAVPDYPHEDLTKPLAERLTVLSELLTKASLLHEGFKAIDRDLQLKVDALNQLVAKTKM